MRERGLFHFMVCWRWRVRLWDGGIPQSTSWGSPGPGNALTPGVIGSRPSGIPLASCHPSMMTSARTLIADDQPEVLEALRLLLKREGFEPSVVSSPDEIVEALQARPFDLLLMDLNYARDTTSGQEGLDLLRQIQALDATLPVIVMTGWGSVELAVEVMRRGVRDFVQKPWDNQRLMAMLRAHIEHGRLERRASRLVAEQRALAAAVGAAENLHALLDTAAERIRRALEARTTVIFSRARDHA